MTYVVTKVVSLPAFVFDAERSKVGVLINRFIKPARQEHHSAKLSVWIDEAAYTAKITATSDLVVRAVEKSLREWLEANKPMTKNKYAVPIQCDDIEAEELHDFLHQLSEDEHVFARFNRRDAEIVIGAREDERLDAANEKVAAYLACLTRDSFPPLDSKK